MGENPGVLTLDSKYMKSVLTIALKVGTQESISSSPGQEATPREGPDSSCRAQAKPVKLAVS